MHLDIKNYSFPERFQSQHLVLQTEIQRFFTEVFQVERPELPIGLKQCFKLVLVQVEYGGLFFCHNISRVFRLIRMDEKIAKEFMCIQRRECHPVAFLVVVDEFKASRGDESDRFTLLTLMTDDIPFGIHTCQGHMLAYVRVLKYRFHHKNPCTVTYDTIVCAVLLYHRSGMEEILMKKLITVLMLVIVTTLASCANENTDPTSLDVVVPAGSPQFSQLYLQGNEEDYEGFTMNVDTVQGAETLPSAFGSESHDIIYAPTNLGAKLIDTGVPYQFAAAVTHGNLYLVSEDPIDSIADLEGKSITLFGQNATPDIIMSSLIDAGDMENPPSLNYVDSVQSALSAYQTGDSDIVMLAEPLLSTLEQNSSSLNVLDLQDSWETEFDKDSYPQAGVFIHEDIDPSVVSEYLGALENSINKANEDPETVASLAETLDVPFDKAVLESAIPRSHLKFVHAQDSKSDLEFYFEQILEMNPALINEELPEPSFYLARHED